MALTFHSHYRLLPTLIVIFNVMVFNVTMVTDRMTFLMSK